MTNISLQRQLNDFLQIIKDILDQLYNNESNFFEEDLCERAIVFRFAYQLQKYFEPYWYYVDCDYNSSCFYDEETGERKGQKWKPIQNLETWEITGRFVDIIVHKRSLPTNWQDSSISDLICFECKKRDNKKNNWIKKDMNNLKVLTHNYGYKYWFHLIFGQNKEKCEINIYQNGNIYND